MTPRTRKPMTCPHCGNRKAALIEDNGPRSRRDDDSTLLCVARVEPKDEANKYEPRQDPGPDGKVLCGMQWCP